MLYLTHGDVKLAYEDLQGSASDNGTFVFVHGWTCNHTYFKPQAEFAHKAGYRAVSVDLRGHGLSDRPTGDYPIEQFADDTAHVIQSLGLDRPVAVGHSMGGLTVLALASRHPELVRGIVMVDPAPIDPPPQMREAIASMVNSLESGDADPQKSFVRDVLFLPTDDKNLRNKVLKEMTAAPTHVAVAAMRGVLDFDGKNAAKNCNVPALHIAAEPPLNRQREISKLLPGVINAQTSGAGHFNHLLVPTQVNDMINYFVKNFISW